MPRFDRTGPLGMGPMTGMARGLCSENFVKEYDDINYSRFGRGFTRRNLGRRFDRKGLGRGFGFRNR